LLCQAGGSQRECLTSVASSHLSGEVSHHCVNYRHLWTEQRSKKKTRTSDCLLRSGLAARKTRSTFTMDREPSIPSDPVSMRRQHHPVLPPWEVRSVAQVPFIEPSSPPLARRDDQGFFGSRPTSHANHRPKFSASMSAPGVAEYSSLEHGSSMPRKTATTVPSRSIPAEPSYETPVYQRPTHDRPAYEDPNHYKPAFRKAASQPPPNSTPQAPPTPPDSVSKASLRSASASPPIRPASKALPGTMSSRASRNRSASHNRTKAGGREHRSERQPVKQDQNGLGKRFKSAFRDIFKKDPVDDSQFERISDRHWTDEY
jgi:hypothetical protein